MIHNIALVDENRIRTVAKALAKSIEFIDLLEEKDFQYVAVKNILSTIGDIVDAAYIIVGIASISYMLSLKGEKHWLLLADYVSKMADSSPTIILEEFVKKSPSLARFRVNRLKRIRILNENYSFFKQKYQIFINDLNNLRKYLALIYNAGINDKTIVFAVKMFYYVLKACNIETRIPFDIPIPVDYRISLVSLTSGLIEIPTNDYSVAANVLRSKYSKLVRSVWEKVSRKSQIPALRIDSPLWIIGGFIEKTLYNYNRLLEEIEEFIHQKLKPAWIELINELTIKLIIR